MRIFEKTFDNINIPFVDEIDILILDLLFNVSQSFLKLDY